ncbi:MAG: serine/threonine-protein kinase [Cyanobacteria bacterium P01_F01_bin.4]
MVLSAQSESSARSQYRRLALIGHGQFGRVYCAMHRRTGEIVALKVLNRRRLTAPSFLYEQRYRLKFNHPNLVICKAIETLDEGRQLVLEYCEGGTLRSQMKRMPRFAEADVLQVGIDILTGLAYVHREGVTHCDIKPENILLHYQQGSWIAKISDFGVAKLTHRVQPPTLGQTGSPAYMAPERFDNRYSPASDIYAVGVLLFELLTGHRPFAGTPAELRLAHLNQSVPVPPDLSAAWQAILLTALAKQPARRYLSAEQMLTVLKTIRPQSSVPSPKPAPAVCPGKLLGQLTQPVKQLWVRPANAPANAPAPGPAFANVSSGELYLAQADQITLAHLSKPSPSEFQSIVTLSTPCQALLGTSQNIWVVSDGGIYAMPVEPPYSLQPMVQFESSGQGAIARRWWASIVPVNHAPKGHHRLTIGSLRLASTASSPWLCQTLALDFEVRQMLAIDEGHLLLVSHPTDHRTQLQLLTRRGHLLGRFNLGLSVRSLTPTRQPYRFLCGSDEVGAVVLDVHPIRVMSLALKIAPILMTALPWGYLFLDAQGQLVIIDRDYQPLGEVQGPQNPTALTVVGGHQLLIATWGATQADSGELYSLDLKDLDLDVLF